MSFMDKLKGFSNNPEYDRDEEYDDVYGRDEYGDMEDSYDEDYQGGYDDSDYDEPVQQNHQTSYSSGNNRFVDISSNFQVQVVVAKPKVFDEVTGISDHLNAKRTVVLNLEDCIANQNPNEPNVARRIVDFIGGVAYANDGKINRITKSTYIIIPRNVDLVGDLDIENFDDRDVFNNDN